MYDGDFNGIVDEKLDYNRHKAIKHTRKILLKSFFKMIEEINLKDSWRERNAKSRQYNFYSDRHSSRSRLDLIWTTMELTSNIQEIEIEANTWVDHNPATVKWKG